MTALARFESKLPSFILLILFALIPFQRRFHGCVDSFSRTLKLPDFPLPDFFSTKIQLFLIDPIILILTLFLLLRFKTSLRDFFWHGPSKYLTLFFLFTLVSLFFSSTSHYSLQYFRLMQFSMVFLLFNTITQIKLDIATFIDRVAWVLVTVCCIECVIGIYQYFTQHSIGLHWLGETNVQLFRFQNPGKQRWFIDQILASSNSPVMLIRTSGTFSHPNIFGGFLFCSLMSSLYLRMKEIQKRNKAFLLGAMLLQIFALYTTFSRSALLALIFAASIWLYLHFRQILKERATRALAFKRLALVVGILLGGGLMGLSLFFSQIVARGGIVNYNHIAQYSDNERLHYIKMTLVLIKEHPFFGVGFNNFQLYTDVNAKGPILFSKVHNIYLLIAAEMGLIGAALFALFIFTLVKNGTRSIFSSAHFPQRCFLLSTFLGLLVIGCCDFYLIDSVHGRMLFFGFAALLAITSQGPRIKSHSFSLD